MSRSSCVCGAGFLHAGDSFYDSQNIWHTLGLCGPKLEEKRAPMIPAEFEAKIVRRLAEIMRTELSDDCRMAISVAVAVYAESLACPRCNGKRVTEHADDVFGKHFRVCDACKGHGTIV